jgi:hypothetical protein
VFKKWSSALLSNKNTDLLGFIVLWLGATEAAAAS